MLLIALFLVHGTGSGVPAQAAPPRALAVGARVESRLPARTASGVPEEVFELDPGDQNTVTLTLESLDFDVLLTVVDPASGEEKRERGTWRQSNAWLVQAGKVPTRLLVHVGSEDGRGGQYVLAVRPGRIDPPRGAAATREAAEYCKSVAGRAADQGEMPRAARFFGIASQAAFKVEAFELARQMAEKQLETGQSADLPQEVLRAQVNLGGAERALGHRERARDLLESALESIEAEPPTPSSAAMAVFLCDNLGDLACEAGGFAPAIPFYRKALEFIPAAKRPDFEPVGWCKLGSALSEVGEVDEACAAIEKGVGLAEALAQPAGLSSALLSRGRFLGRHGEPAEARAVCERALALAPPPAIAIELSGTLANACIDLGKYEEALAAFDTVEARALEFGLGRYEIPIRISRARIAYDLYDLSGARELLQDALARQEISGSPLHRADILHMLGRIALELGQLDAANKCYVQALEACDRAGEREKHASYLVSLAILQEKRGELAAATESCAKAEAIAREVGSTYVEDLARNERAYVLLLDGHPDEAREIATAVARGREDPGDFRFAWEAYDTLARIGLYVGDLDAAESALRSAEKILERHRAPLDRFGAAGFRARFAKWGSIHQDLIARRAEAPGLSERERDALVLEGWRAAGEWKGRILLEHLAKAPSGTSALPRIDERTAILEFVDGVEKLYAYVALPDSVRLVDLGERKSVESKAQALVESLARGGIPPRIYATDAIWLHERLLAPLLAQLPAGTATLIVVPSPELAVLPFDALVKPAEADQLEHYAGMRFVIDDYTVAYAPSSPVLAELQRRGPKGTDPRFLILGDPVYADEGTGTAPFEEEVAYARPGGADFDLPRLKHTKDEVLEIARLLLVEDKTATDAQRSKLLQAGSERNPSLETKSFDLYLGSGASRAAFARDLAVYSCLHIAAHGHVDPDDARRSGLILSGEHDRSGMFTLEEVVGLHLDADLAVLSACGTAKGPIVSGEGIQSVANAFLDAGARSVVATLWKVVDVDASAIMRSFYGAHLGEKLHPAVALRRAKLEFRNSKEDRGVNVRDPPTGSVTAPANPSFWAPFVYVGAGPR